MITYKPIEFFERGIIQKLIKKCYEDLFHYFPDEKLRLYKHWEQEDKKAFNNPSTIGKNLLFTCLNDNPIGYFCWNNRKFSKGVIGQNCVLPEYQNRGYGKKQVEAMIKIFEDAKFSEISAITGDHDFFKPAQNMYIGCGFKEKRKLKGDLFRRIEFIRLLY
jgi:GNAT superfamily N-acetyltransferase